MQRYELFFIYNSPREMPCVIITVAPFITCVIHF